MANVTNFKRWLIDFTAKRIEIFRTYFSFINISDFPADIFSFYLMNYTLIYSVHLCVGTIHFWEGLTIHPIFKLKTANS